MIKNTATRTSSGAPPRRRRPKASLSNPTFCLGTPLPTICDFVDREQVDLLVVGYMGHSALYNRLIGSTTDRLVEHAACTVLVVK